MSFSNIINDFSEVVETGSSFRKGIEPTERDPTEKEELSAKVRRYATPVMKELYSAEREHDVIALALFRYNKLKGRFERLKGENAQLRGHIRNLERQLSVKRQREDSCDSLRAEEPPFKRPAKSHPQDFQREDASTPFPVHSLLGNDEPWPGRSQAYPSW